MRFTSHLAFAALLAACGGSSGGTTTTGGGGGAAKDGGGTTTTGGGGTAKDGGSTTTGGNDGGGKTTGGGDGGTTTGGNDGGGVTTGSTANTVPMIVDSGPTGAQYSSYNVPYVTITLCAPGSTTNCATIDHVSVDTGSEGLRVLSSAIPSSLASALTATKSTTGSPVAECYAFADGYVWGSVKQADLTIGQKKVANLAFELVGDTALSTVPANCKKNGDSEDTLDTFGSNGLIGVGVFTSDCGSYCTSSSGFSDETYPYYACPTATTCTPTVLAEAAQVTNPVSLFASDNNGVVLQLPAIDAGGAASPQGTLLFGIGTQTNNALGPAQVITTDDEGNISVTYNSHKYTYGFFDSGSTDITFQDTAIPACTGDYAGWSCPAAPVTINTENLDAAGGMHAGTFTIANTNTLFNANAAFTAFDDTGEPSPDDATIFDYGLPFFFGRTMFTAFDGMSTPGGTGPYYAY